MSNLLMAFGFLTMVGLSSAALTLGCALVCRWLKWSPVTVCVTVNNNINHVDE